MVKREQTRRRGRHIISRRFVRWKSSVGIAFRAFHAERKRTERAEEKIRVFSSLDLTKRVDGYTNEKRNKRPTVKITHGKTYKTASRHDEISFSHHRLGLFVGRKNKGSVQIENAFN